MDRKRYTKIKKYVVIYIVFSLLFSLCLYMQIHLERMAEQRRMLTLLESHPEWEAEIVALWYKTDDSHMMAADERTEQGADEEKNQRQQSEETL